MKGFFCEGIFLNGNNKLLIYGVVVVVLVWYLGCWDYSYRIGRVVIFYVWFVFYEVIAEI